MRDEIDVFSGALALLALILILRLERQVKRLEGAVEKATGEELPGLGPYSTTHRVFVFVIVLSYVLLFLVVGFSLYETLTSR